MTETPPVRLIALGPPEVRVGTEALELYPKRLAVLTYVALASSDGVIRRDSLLGLFWPESDERRARNALNQVVHHLRRRLGAQVLVSRGQEELIAGSRLRTDVDQFEDHLRNGETEAALALYRGDFLEGFHVSEAPGFERWLDGVRVRLRREARRAVTDLATEAETAGRPLEAAGHIRRVLELSPCDETAARHLIRLLLAAGHRSAAFEEYRHLVRRLKANLGTGPSDRTRALVEEAGLDPEAAPSSLQIMSAPSPSQRLASQLTERAGELVDTGRLENAAARELLAQATRIDPTYAPAHATYARAIASWVQIFGGTQQEIGSALAAARDALTVDPELPEAHSARAHAFEAARRPHEASRAYRTALQLRPDDPELVTHLARNLGFAGNFAGALEQLQAVLASSDPGAELLTDLALFRHCLGDHAEGDASYDRAVENQPGFRWAEVSRVFWDFVSGKRDQAVHRGEEIVAREPDGFMGSFAAGDARLMAEDLEGAISYYERCLALAPEGRQMGYLRSIRTALGYAYLRAGDAVHGTEMLDEAERAAIQALDSGCSHGGIHYELAAIYATHREDEQRALDQLESAYRAGWLQPEFLELDPLLAPLRQEARFQDVHRAMERTIQEQRSRLG